jgi:hypothetical protein
MPTIEQQVGPTRKQLPFTTVRKRWRAGVFWIVFSVGLLFQYFAPRVETARDAFVISPVSDGRETRPAEIVARARTMQLLSAIFTVTGALGLGIYYRVNLAKLVRPSSR